MEASEILASVLKDMNEIIDATGAEKSQMMKCNGTQLENVNGECINLKEEGINDTELKKQSRGSLVIPDLSESYVNVTGNHGSPPRTLTEENAQSQSKTRRLPTEMNPSVVIPCSSPVTTRLNLELQPRSTSLGPGSVISVDTESETVDHLQARLVLLQKQVNAQAHRIAELEQKRKHPLNTVLGNVASLEKLDLLAEVSKQQVQIANLENAKRDLEMQVDRLRRRLARIPSAMDIECEMGHSGSRLDMTRRATTPGPESIKLNSNMENGVHLMEDQLALGCLNSTKLADQLTFHATPNSHLSPLITHRNLAASRSYMLPSGGSPVNLNPMPSHGYAGPLGMRLPNDTLRHTPLSLLGSSGYYKSASLNELRHHRTNTWDGHNIQSNMLQRLPRPIDWVETDRGGGGGGGGCMRFGLSPVDSTYNQVYASPPQPQALTNSQQLLQSATGPLDRLPPQYASNYHRQAYLTTRARSPPPNVARHDNVNPGERGFDLDNPPHRWYAGEMHQLSSTPCLSDSNAIAPTDTMVNGLKAERPDRCSPTVHRNTDKTGARCEPQNFMTPPVGRRILPSSPAGTIIANGAPINHNVPSSGEATTSVVTSRFKRILASTPFHRLLRHRNSTSSNHRNTVDQHPLMVEPGQVAECNVPHLSHGQMHPYPADRNGTKYSPAATGSVQDQQAVNTTAFHIPERRVPAVSNGGALARPVLADYGLTQETGVLSQTNNGLFNSSLNSQVQSVTSTSEKSGRNSKCDGIDFVHWDKDMVSAWLYELGLGYSVPYARRWLQHGSDLVHASRKEIEQEMGIRNALHLKKLYLHLQLRTKESISIYSSYPLLRVQYPAQFNMPAWLDDLGLTSYTAAFDAAAIDLLVLNHLTTADLVSLKMTNELHFLSLRRGLQMLRRMNYDLSQICRGSEDVADAVWPYSSSRSRTDALIRKPDSKVDLPNGDVASDANSHGSPSGAMTNSVIAPAGDEQPDTNTQPVTGGQRNSLTRARQFPLHVCYWSQYRVMAWLHQIELPEYAPELCGSGVHGALMVLEDRFTPELLASILHIPSSKTLVRRHLANKFAELMGEHIWRRKQELAETPDVPPLTTHSKNKTGRKRSIFSAHWRQKSSLLEEEFLCPADIDSQHPELFAEEAPPSDPVHVTPTDSTSIQSMKPRETDL